MARNNNVSMKVGSDCSLKDVGWVWEGRTFHPGTEPSIFGVGEGAVYFGLRRVVYIFHPNTDLAMQKLSNFEEVTCDISKGKFSCTKDHLLKQYIDSAPPTVGAEATKVSKLSLKYHNITGGFHDDMFGATQRESGGFEHYAWNIFEGIRNALHAANSTLKLWGAVYTQELNSPLWQNFLPYIDIVNLWVWHARDLRQLDEHIVLCRKIFPNKPINLGCYMREYPAQSPLPMNLLRFQWERVRRYLDKGLINGYSILGALEIDFQQEQAEWIRGFIAKH